MKPPPDSLSCSFCNKAQSDVVKLISSPSGQQRAYICNECIAVCDAILGDQGGPAISFDPGTPVDVSPLLRHRLAPEFMNSVERWIRKDSLGSETTEEFAEARSLASRMVAGE